MSHEATVQSRISARDRAQQLMNRLTAGIAVLAVTGVGALGYLSAETKPGSASPTSTTAATTTLPSTSGATSASTSSSGLQSSSGTVSSSSGTGVVVSGGS